MSQLRENRAFTSRFVAIAAVLTAILSFLVQQIPLLTVGIPVLVRFLAIVGFVAAVVSWVLNRYLWRVTPFAQLLSIPDFSGRWEGWYRPAISDTGLGDSKVTNDWRPTAHEVSQRALDVDAEAWGPKNWSRGACSAIVVASRDLTAELVWAYKSEPTTKEYKPGDMHNGVHFLRMVERDGKRFLLGKYITDRPHEKGKGGVGEVELCWVSNKLQHELHFTEGSWGLDKPQ